jgi:hypothetical protein
MKSNTYWIIGNSYFCIKSSWLRYKQTSKKKLSKSDDSGLVA